MYLVSHEYYQRRLKFVSPKFFYSINTLRHKCCCTITNSTRCYIYDELPGRYFFGVFRQATFIFTFFFSRGTGKVTPTVRCVCALAPSRGKYVSIALGRLSHRLMCLFCSLIPDIFWTRDWNLLFDLCLKSSGGFSNHIRGFVMPWECRINKYGNIRIEEL